jgi:hypothetical protein
MRVQYFIKLELNNNAMRLLLTIVVFILGDMASAQNPKGEIHALPGAKFDRKQMDSLLSIYKDKYPENFKQVSPMVQTYRMPGVKLEKKQIDSVLAIYKNKHPEKLKSLHKPTPGTHYLADGMPCIVPNDATAGLIPNAWKEEVRLPYRPKHKAMPNPALPQAAEPDANVAKEP